MKPTQRAKLPVNANALVEQDRAMRNFLRKLTQSRLWPIHFDDARCSLSGRGNVRLSPGERRPIRCTPSHCAVGVAIELEGLPSERVLGLIFARPTLSVEARLLTGPLRPDVVEPSESYLAEPLADDRVRFVVPKHAWKRHQRPVAKGWHWFVQMCGESKNE